MKLKFNTNLLPIFSGTYETQWEVCEYDDDGNELEVDYTMNDLMKSIARTYTDCAEWIVKDLEIPFIKSIRFTGGFYNPRQYNFKTDQLDFDLIIDYRLLVKTIKQLGTDDQFKTYLNDNFSSYDGFISFTPNNHAELLEQVLTKGNEFEQSVGAVIAYLAGEDRLRNIEQEVWEDWSGNGYNELDYTIGNPYLTE